MQHLSTHRMQLYRIQCLLLLALATAIGGYVSSSDEMASSPFCSAKETLLQWTSADHMRNTKAAWKFSFEHLLNLWKLE